MLQSIAGASWKRRVLPADWMPLGGVLALFLYSTISALRGGGATHFEVASLILILLIVRHWLEIAGNVRARKSLKELQRLLPDHVRVLQGNRQVVVSRDALKIGDHVCALAGHRFVSDGRIVEGNASVDEELITGDTRPVSKAVGAQVYGGTLNLQGTVVFELTAAPSDGMVPRLIRAVDSARARAGRCEQQANRLSSLFFIVVALAASIVLTWCVVNGRLDQGILCVLSIVVIASPVLIVSGTRLALWTALVRAARENILLRNTDALERLAHIKAICFAKTGTLTAGDPRLIDYIVADVDREAEILSIAAAVARASSHVYSVAIANFANHIAAVTMTEARSIAGRGVIARSEGRAGWAYLGSPRFVEEAGLAMNETIRAGYRKSIDEGLPTVFAGWNGQIQALFVFADTLRPGVHSLLRALESTGKTCAVLTGDQWQWAQALKSEPGVSVLTGLSPEEKPRCIRTYHDRFGATAMVGDGVNDASALAAADISIALGCGADSSCHLADVCLMGNDLEQLPWLFALADATLRKIRHNLYWVCGYNVVGIGLAMTGVINPIVACLLMIAVSGLVITTSLRLGRFELASTDTAPLETASATTVARFETLPRQDTLIPDAVRSAEPAMIRIPGVSMSER